METMVAYCGITCTKCPTYLATQNNDDNARAKVVQQWSKQFGMKIRIEDINCDGCKSDNGRLFGHCSQCKIRECSRNKNLTSCALCDDYPCQTLEAFHQMVPIAKNTLDTMRSYKPR